MCLSQERRSGIGCFFVDTASCGWFKVGGTSKEIGIEYSRLAGVVVAASKAFLLWFEAIIDALVDGLVEGYLLEY